MNTRHLENYTVKHAQSSYGGLLSVISGNVVF